MIVASVNDSSLNGLHHTVDMPTTSMEEKTRGSYNTPQSPHHHQVIQWHSLLHGRASNDTLMFCLGLPDPQHRHELLRDWWEIVQRLFGRDLRLYAAPLNRSEVKMEDVWYFVIYDLSEKIAIQELKISKESLQNKWYSTFHSFRLHSQSLVTCINRGALDVLTESCLEILLPAKICMCVCFEREN